MEDMVDLDVCPAEEVLMHRRALRRELAAKKNLQDIRIAVLSGSTTEPIVALLEVLLLHSGFRPEFHQGDYGRFYEDAVIDSAALIDFKPDIVYLHTSCYNVQNTPARAASEQDLSQSVAAEVARWTTVWDALEAKLGCQVIQNNFEMPAQALLGNMDAVSSGGLSRFIMELNVRFAREASARRNLMLQDVQSVAARVGLRQWFDWGRYYSYKVLLKPSAQLELARSVTALVRAIYGRSRKVLVLDLDNTLWGGVIGDDGVDKIYIGRETPKAEAYTAFQEYCLALRSRGVLLAVCSKNDEAVAKTGLQHPDSVLRLEDIACFKANWEPKHENLLAIASELSLDVASFVFVDDNPAERALVKAQLPAVAVPDVGDDVTHFADAVEAGRYFEPAALVSEDFQRAELYQGNAQRHTEAASFADYGEYLDSLEMRSEIAPFQPLYLERIAQLTNKTNQFNLTTRRYTAAEIGAIANDPAFLTLYGKLSDRFGDNGLISIVVGEREGDTLHLRLWLMSCRVLKREMEQAMLDAVVGEAKRAGVQRLVGYYLPTPKNSMVASHYRNLGFLPAEVAADLPEGATVWALDLLTYQPKNTHIEILELTHA